MADDLEGLDAWRTRLEGEIRLCAPSAAAASKALIAAVAGQPVTDGLMHETARRLSEQRASPLQLFKPSRREQRVQRSSESDATAAHQQLNTRMQ